MGKKWFLVGTAAYLFLCFIVFPFLLHLPVVLTFGSDAIAYSGAAVNFLKYGFLSLDNIHPLVEREPGMSMFLALVYSVFGIENAWGFFVAQGLFLFAASFAFSTQIGRVTSARVGGLCFLLLLTSGSVLHSMFSAYRECFALIVLLFFSALYFSDRKSPSLWKIAGMGLLFGALILTYYSFVFFPPVLLFVRFVDRRPFLPMVAAIVLCYAIVAVAGIRNYSYDGRFRVVDDRRSAAMWYARGEQAQNVRGLEPFRCLWSEYISRDWSNRSPDCSFNAVKNRRWPDGLVASDDYAAIAREGQAKIRTNFLSYLWFSAIDVIELHLPFVGGGWSTAFNAYAALTAFILYVGCLFAVRLLFDRRFLFLTLIIFYNTGVFVLTDATPRYLVPVLFCYAVFGALGYDALLKRFHRS
jgi:hypothetical protein